MQSYVDSSWDSFLEVKARIKHVMTPAIMRWRVRVGRSCSGVVSDQEINKETVREKI